MVLVSSEKVLREILTSRRNNGFHFSPKGKNGVQHAICAPGVKQNDEILLNIYQNSYHHCISPMFENSYAIWKPASV